MKCLICARFCLGVLCEGCLDSIVLTPRKRVVSGVTIYTFFAYEDIDFLLSSKYYAIGSRIFTHLSRIASAYFFRQKTDFSGIYGVGIDDYVRSFYSHTGVILKHFCQSGIRPIYGQLRAQNVISMRANRLSIAKTTSAICFIAQKPKM
ncbi:HP1473-transformation associated protein [Helicobacter fennelliae]|uniref:HP1473-transformation associated protein n=1 Tax=Helicobacter fennelliae TaxID=215 RepID=A0A2X3EIF5_9HELI|nr:hypothetical protein [Helicobacter fennelliae]SQC36263.1 HP1473-transformation associated protein [Helicobacter fennelliae]